MPRKIKTDVLEAASIPGVTTVVLNDDDTVDLGLEGNKKYIITITDDYLNTDNDDNQLLHFPFPEWLRHSFVRCRTRAVDEFARACHQCRPYA